MAMCPREGREHPKVTAIFFLLVAGWGRRPQFSRLGGAGGGAGFVSSFGTNKERIGPGGEVLPALLGSEPAASQEQELFRRNN